MWVASGIKAIQVIDEGRGVVGVIEIAMGGQDTGPAYIRMRLPLARGPLDPLITTLLDQPPGRAAAPALSRRTVAPPGVALSASISASLIRHQHVKSRNTTRKQHSQQERDAAKDLAKEPRKVEMSHMQTSRARYARRADEQMNNPNKRHSVARPMCMNSGGRPPPTSRPTWAVNNPQMGEPRGNEIDTLHVAWFL